MKERTPGRSGTRAGGLAAMATCARNRVAKYLWYVCDGERERRGGEGGGKRQNVGVSRNESLFMNAVPQGVSCIP